MASSRVAGLESLVEQLEKKPLSLAILMMLRYWNFSIKVHYWKDFSEHVTWGGHISGGGGGGGGGGATCL